MDAFGEEPEGRPPAGAGENARPDADTLTYEPYYGLREKPFSLSTDPRFLYRSGAHTPVLHDLAAAIKRREGLIVLTGDIGLGKTTLCRAVLSQLDRKTFATFVPDPFVTREDLLKIMLIDFGVMSVEDVVKGRLKGASRPELSYPLYEFLQALAPLDAFAVVVIDEVQNLSLPLLEEIRILSDLEMAGRKLLQVVLVGQPEFDEQLRVPRMRQIKQRITVHCELGPLGRDGAAGYVAHRLATAGATPDQVRITEEALDLVHTASGGVPRVINLLCDKALACGHAARTSRIGSDLVRMAIADLRLPSPAAAAVVATAPAPTPAASPRAMTPVVPVPVVPVPVEARAHAPATPPTAEPVGEAKGLLEAKAGVAPPAGGQDLISLLDLPAVDLKVTFEERPSRRATRAASAQRAPVARGKVWSRSQRLRPAAAVALTVLGLTTAVSLVAYWIWLRPLYATAVLLPTVSRPAAAATTLGPLILDASGRATSATAPPAATTVAAPAGSGGRWAIQAGAFSTAARAGAVVQQLEGQGYPAFQREQAFARERYRVAFAGPYASREDAERALGTLRLVPGFEGSLLRPLPTP